MDERISPKQYALSTFSKFGGIKHERTFGLLFHLQVIFISSRYFISFEVRKTAKIRNQYNQVPHLTKDTTWESDEITVRHHKQEPRGQPFPSR